MTEIITNTYIESPEDTLYHVLEGIELTFGADVEYRKTNQEDGSYLFYVYESSPSLDKYSSVEDADAYLADEEGDLDAWFGSTEREKNKALESATRKMLRLPWKGLPATISQRLFHPIAGETTVPVALQNACALIAAALRDGRDVEQDYLQNSLSSERYSSIGISRNTDHQAPHLVAGIPSLEAWRLIRPYLAELGPVGIIRVN